MLSRKNKLVLLKLASLFSVVRGYNILILFIAQYLASIYILAPNMPIRDIILDVNLFLLVIASTFAIASGYLINNFYDAEKDLINRPHKTLLDNYISQKTKLAIYFTLNFLSVILASYVSFKAVIFFSVFIFFLWFYSHKLKKYPFIGTLVASLLAITPFFVVFVYYHNFDMVIFVHATFLFLIISIRELTKDLENLKGDLTQDYRTIPVVYGVKFSKIIISSLVALTLVPTLILIFKKFEIGYMHYYFLLSFILMITFLFFLWKSSSKLQYTLLHNLLKLIIVIGVFSILLIDIDVVLNRVL
ncbi:MULTISPECIES: geranylgeranylglycerol-phosphate geranylgeranyltransferase [Mesonia]|uniref:geranylgeranylglycerol-phosphate geranylgeranyltransferase n=1 Tax=Mesonia TaxID=232115 RepID=UPI000C3C5177|nr:MULTISPECIES: geranylgeranylglycerol-phosphate geranylgeranyltransferase [Mesonia]MAN27807.1 ubiquinone biosynthesis protein UbiA [Mesonia sp.]MAQ40987.1 ubiquinone biosynthesis protein UbiA [Mesonia sp.]MBJ96473.1 ubiquinone biosynthesis protein UbiA [Flavobacteriaceae bacterium]HAX16449.1 ubiquinone biosynthesis protein UbiA [Leeuwenhoekiella sp.]